MQKQSFMPKLPNYLNNCKFLLSNGLAHTKFYRNQEINTKKHALSPTYCFLKSIIDEVRTEMLNKIKNRKDSESYRDIIEPVKEANLENVQDDSDAENPFKRVGKVRFACSSSPESVSNASLKSITASFSIANSTEYGGASERYIYSRHRDVPPRSSREHPEQDLRDVEERHHHHHHHHHHHRDGSVKRGQFTRSLSNTEPSVDEKAGKC